MATGNSRAMDHYQAGRLNDAVQAAIDDVRQRPTDVAARWALSELFCFVGDLERADKQLDVIVTQDPTALPGVSLFRQLIRAETARRQVFDEGRPPELFCDPTPDMRPRLQALLALRQGPADDVARLLDEAETLRPHVTGKTSDGVPFDDLRDLDDLTAGVLELHTPNGKYAWVPLAAVTSFEPHAPKRLRDLIWKPAALSVRGGPEGEVFLPTLYPGTHASADDRLRLGRSTDWVGQPARGVGLKCFLTGEESKSIAELGAMTFGNE